MNIEPGQRLQRKFYTTLTLDVAKNLLGKYIVRMYRRKPIVGKIIETEAYIGPYDKASHTYDNKRTPRTEAMFSEGGRVYMYLIYGMYWMLNISTYVKEKPEAVLIRALEPTPLFSPFSKGVNGSSSPFYKGRYRRVNKNVKVANGPGKVCNFLKLDKKFYGEDLAASERMWIEDRGVRISKKSIVAAVRVGVDYAGPVWSQKPWRFYLRENVHVSQARK